MAKTKLILGGLITANIIPVLIFIILDFRLPEWLLHFCILWTLTTNIAVWGGEAWIVWKSGKASSDFERIAPVLETLGDVLEPIGDRIRKLSIKEKALIRERFSELLEEYLIREPEGDLTEDEVNKIVLDYLNKERKK